MPSFLTEATGKAFHDAIASIEAASSAEIVIAVRGRARRVAAPAIAIGLAVAITMLALTLYADTEFALWQIFALPIVTGALGATIAQLGPIERLLVSPPARRAQVRDAARTAFYERGVHATTKRTGVLVFVALHERVVELVGDVAVVAAVGQAQLDAWGDLLAAQLAAGGAATATALAGLAGAFSKKLPNRAGETNELADDVVDVHQPRGLRRLRGVDA